MIAWRFSPYALVQFATAVFCIWIAIGLWQRRHAKGAITLAFILLALGEWTLTSGLELAAIDRETKILFAKLMYLGVQSVSPLLLIFAIQFSEKKHWLTGRNLILLAAIPVITLALVATNELHGLIWSRVYSSPVPGSTDLVYEHGLGFYISSIYHYVTILIASVLFIIGAYRRKGRRQLLNLLLILLALGVSWVSNIAYVLGLVPVVGLDITPFSITITSTLLYLVIYHFRFFDLMPVARSKLVDTMTDAVFVIDEDNLLLDINPAGLALLGRKTSQLINKPLQHVFEHWPYLVNRLQTHIPGSTDVFVIQDSPNLWYEVRTIPLSKMDTSSPGWLVMMRDISISKQTEIEFKHQAVGLKTVSEIGLDIAANQDPQALLQHVVELTRTRFQLYYVQIFLLCEATQTLYLAAATGEAGKRLLSDNFSLLLNQEKSIIARSARNHETIVVNDVRQDPSYLDNPLLPDTCSEMAVPVLSSDKLLGVLDIQSAHLDHFNDADRYIQNTLAAQVSVALQNTHMLEMLRERQEQLSVINRIGVQVGAALESNQVLSILYANLHQILPLDFFHVALLDNNGSDLLYPVIVDPDGYRAYPLDETNKYAVPETAGLTNEVIHSGESLVIADIWDTAWAKEIPGQPSHGMAPRSYLGVPLIYLDTVTGAIAVMKLTPAAYSENHTHLLETVANQVAIALANTRLFQDTHRLAIIDPLTGIFNRRQFFHLAQLEYERSVRYNHPLSALMIDLDEFKSVNDTHGHATGDRVLQMVADLCRDHLRKIDILGRYGGEEYVVIMPETNANRAMLVAERLRRKIARTPFQVGAVEVGITVSVGVATYEPDDFSDASAEDAIRQLVEMADRAQYQAKETGRNQVAV